ncbi:unnamed protein product [Rodentolepis nana]|uniref:Protein rolling stone n=1 Tax=Rodentolepis nana TaxID=102285 RepID=A0A0R3SZX6_RODNA|nr:unnamed protein product [Rodentolepis nana]
MEDKAEKRSNCCQTLGKAFRYEFKCRNLGFSGAQYDHFPFAQWMWMDKFFYPIYRFIIAIGLLAWACVEIVEEIEQSKHTHTKSKYFLYATNWSFLTYTVSSMVFAIFCTFYNCKKGEVTYAKASRWISEILWFFYGMSMNTVVVTSLGYWAALWDPTYYRFYKPESEFKHTIPALTVILDLFLNGLPIRLLHAIYPMIFGILYSTFSFLYFDTGHEKPIYPVLDWSQPTKAAIVCTTIIIVGLIVQFLLYLLYVGRITLSAHLNGRGKVVVDSWWNAGSQATPVNEAVESEEIVETEISTDAKGKGDVEVGYISSK